MYTSAETNEGTSTTVTRTVKDFIGVSGGDGQRLCKDCPKALEDWEEEHNEVM
jgi:hypothetical protein